MKKLKRTLNSRNANYHSVQNLLSSCFLSFKGKVVPVLFLTEHHVIKAYWGVEAELHTFLTSALDRGEWSASHPSHFTHREGTQVPIGQGAGWAPEPVWPWWRRGKFPAPARTQMPNLPSHSPALYH